MKFSERYLTLFLLALTLNLSTSNHSHAVTMTCSQAASTTHAQYLRKSDKLHAILGDLILEDSEVCGLTQKNEYLPAYIVAKYDLDENLPEDVKAAILEAFASPGENLMTTEELNEIDRIVNSKFEIEGAREETATAVRNARDEFNQFRDQLANKARYKNMVTTFRKIKRIINLEFKTGNLDANLFAFHGFHNVRTSKGATPRIYTQRQWNQISPNGISASDAEYVNQNEYAAVALFAKEVEDPIMYYSGESGSALQAILPKLGRFMGKTDEQMLYAYNQNRNNPKWCESPWCEEEKRHGPFLGKIYERFTGRSSDFGNPHETTAVLTTLEDAIYHLYSRQANEWAASSAYVYLAGHAKDGSVLQDYVMNIARDEFKHLSIVSGAYLYLFGPQLNQRVVEMLKITLDQLKMHQAARTTGGDVFNHPLAKIEVVMIYAIMEMRVREWIKTVPYKTVKLFFDGASQATELPAVAQSAENHERISQQMAEAKRMRENLTLWNPIQRAEALAQEKFETDHQTLINQIIEKDFNGFRGMEDPDSNASKEAFKTMRGYVLRNLDTQLLRKVLYDDLRHYQIMNNYIQIEVARTDGEVKFGGKK